jgi:hypothetical protein
MRWREKARGDEMNSWKTTPIRSTSLAKGELRDVAIVIVVDEELEALSKEQLGGMGQTVRMTKFLLCALHQRLSLF